MPKLYTFGDSFTYGYNFLPDEELRKRSIWPTKLSTLLNYELVDLSIPGGSNWRIARLISSMNFEPDCLVVIAFSTHKRFEFGVNKQHNSPEIFIKNGLPLIGDLIETEGNLLTKRFFPQLSERTSDIDAKIFSAIAFSEFFNEEWFSKMQGVNFNSIQHNLQNKKWMVFNAWSKPFEKNDYWVEQANIKNYVLGVNNVMSEILSNTSDDSFFYLDKDQHTKLADILLKEYKNIYD
jgi:hypothetical protein